MVNSLWRAKMQESGINAEMPEHNPLTKTGKKVMASMRREYGKKKGKQVFFASINKGIKGSKKWHG